MNDIVIRVCNVSKCYKVFANPRVRLRQALWPRSQRGLQEIWALRDISFEVRRGEAVAIIGRNGSGKSTLLEILAGTSTPTQGEVQINGRISALLELGSGFNPDYSGKDNVILNGLLLGLSREDILRRFDEIVAFADIGDVLDRPVKTYSSGMLMRLAFAVQVLTDPDILIIDEALAVGDYFFQQKCFGYIRTLLQKGITLLFVSHDMATVRDLCPKALYLIKGKNAFFGDSKEAIRAFFSEGSISLPQTSDLTSPIEPIQRLSTAQNALEAAIESALWHRSLEVVLKNGCERLLAVIVRNTQGQPATSVKIGDTLTFQIFFHTAHDEEGHISLSIKNKYDQIVSVTGSYLLGLPALCSGNNPYSVFEIEIDFMIEAGLYSFQVNFAKPREYNLGDCIDITEWLGPIQVIWNYESERAPFLGLFGIPARTHSTNHQEIN